jgi:hypothetical protein
MLLVSRANSLSFRNGKDMEGTSKLYQVNFACSTHLQIYNSTNTFLKQYSGMDSRFKDMFGSHNGCHVKISAPLWEVHFQCATFT